MTGSDMSILAINAESSGGGPFNLILLLLIPVAFYFLLIRPQSKRRREQLQMQRALEPGARVLTTNGMYATVVEVDDDGVVLEIAPGVEARFVKQAVMQVLKGDDPEGLADDDDDEDDDDESTGKVDLGKGESAEDDSEATRHDVHDAENGEVRKKGSKSEDRSSA